MIECFMTSLDRRDLLVLVTREVDASECEYHLGIAICMLCQRMRITVGTMTRRKRMILIRFAAGFSERC